MKSYTKVEVDKNGFKNRDDLMKRNFSKPKSRNNSNVHVSISNQTVNVNKSNSKLKNILNKSMKPRDRGISEDLLKNNSNLLFIFNFSRFTKNTYSKKKG